MARIIQLFQFLGYIPQSIGLKSCSFRFMTDNKIVMNDFDGKVWILIMLFKICLAIGNTKGIVQTHMFDLWSYQWMTSSTKYFIKGCLIVHRMQCTMCSIVPFCQEKGMNHCGGS